MSALVGAAFERAVRVGQYPHVVVEVVADPGGHGVAGLEAARFEAPP